MCMGFADIEVELGHADHSSIAAHALIMAELNAT